MFIPFKNHKITILFVQLFFPFHFLLVFLKSKVKGKINDNKKVFTMNNTDNNNKVWKDRCFYSESVKFCVKGIPQNWYTFWQSFKMNAV